MSMDSEMSESCDRKAFFSEGLRTIAGVVLAGGVLIPERAAAAAAKKAQEVVSAAVNTSWLVCFFFVVTFSFQLNADWLVCFWSYFVHDGCSCVPGMYMKMTQHVGVVASPVNDGRESMAVAYCSSMWVSRARPKRRMDIVPLRSHPSPRPRVASAFLLYGHGRPCSKTICCYAPNRQHDSSDDARGDTEGSIVDTRVCLRG